MKDFFIKNFVGISASLILLLIVSHTMESYFVKDKIARRQLRPNPINQFERSFREPRYEAIKGQD